MLKPKRTSRLDSGRYGAHVRGLPPTRSRYERRRDLPRLLPVLAEDIAVRSYDDHARLVAMLRRALRLERRRGLAGDWTYDLARHAGLLEAYRMEAAALAARARRRPTRATAKSRTHARPG
ncbi:MAG TPA: hypothetical protein VNK52_07105 [Hyphomicrobiaceae bacterium]|nr:hypothetical protein [Hyphomicrobiaceae bacterium]